MHHPIAGLHQIELVEAMQTSIGMQSSMIMTSGVHQKVG